jgi:hypothetical protein
MRQTLFILDAELWFKRISLANEAQDELTNKRAIPVLIPFFYLVILGLNFRIRFLKVGLPRLYVLRLFLSELKKDFINSPIRFVIRLCIVSFIYSSNDFKTKFSLTNNRFGRLSIADQPLISSVSLTSPPSISFSGQKRVLFVIKRGCFREFFPTLESLKQDKRIHKVTSISEPYKSLSFQNFTNVNFLNERSFISEQGNLISTTPYELQPYAGLPIRGVVKYGNSDLLMMQNCRADLNNHFSDWVIYFGYSHNPSNYYHFIVEILPRILIYRSTPQKQAKALVHSDTPKQILDIYAKALGSSSILIVEPSEILKFSQVTLARDFRHEKLVDYSDSKLNKSCFASRAFELRSSKLFLEDVFGNSGDIHKWSSSLRAIFLTRKPHLARVPQNLLELEARMLEIGIEVLDTADFTVNEQIALFRDTKLIIALSGASLTNMMFCSKDTLVLMITPDLSPVSFIFWRDYAKIFEVTLVSLSSVYQKLNKSTDYKVDTEELTRIAKFHLNQI